jgi:Protein of unknown function (DUF2946)
MHARRDLSYPASPGAVASRPTAKLDTMCWFRLRLQAIQWLALLVMVALAILPTLAHALARSQGGTTTWAEVCTPQGMKLVAVDLDDATAGAAGQAQAGSHLEHCPYCTGSGTPPALPAAPFTSPDFDPRASFLPPLYLQAPHTLFAWRSAQPRAPPPFS